MSSLLAPLAIVSVLMSLGLDLHLVEDMGQQHPLEEAETEAGQQRGCQHPQPSSGGGGDARQPCWRLESCI